MRLRRLLLVLVVLVVFGFGFGSTVHAADSGPYIIDGAELLTPGEKAELTDLASKLGAERETAFVILTMNGTDGKDIVHYVEDFYDAEAPGYDQPHGNTAILAIDLQVRDVYLAGFKKAETYLDDGRLDKIRGKITPDLSAGNYYDAFTDFITLSHQYMGFRPGVNPDNLLFKLWFQLAVALGIAAIVVGIMAYRSGGRVTVNAQTYLDRGDSKVISHYDNFVNQVVTRTKIVKSSSGGGGGGGGGVSRGGHSHSGSRGKF